jgi:hypothetical protein
VALINFVNIHRPVSCDPVGGGDRGIKTQGGGDVWNRVMVMRVMRRLGIGK